ncbi:MAG: endolytic transglycosylase MltG [Hyphomicrobiales bacterium]
MTGEFDNQDDNRQPRMPLPEHLRGREVAAGPAEMRAPQDVRPREDVRVPEAKGRRRSMVSRLGGMLTGLALFCILALAGAAGAYYYGNARFEAPGPLAAEKSILIKRGQSSRAIAAALAREGFISHDKLFLLGLFVHDASGKLKAGEYEIAAGTSMRRIMDMLVQGKAIQHKITVPEGLTTMQIIRRIEDHPILEGKIEQVVAEGSLLPDTYTFPRGTTRQDVVKLMQAAQTAFMEKAWAQRAKGLPVKKPYEALILASIVEKETALARERGRVAGVFVNRMRRRMRLQSDPTIIYGLVGGKGSLKRPLTKADIAKETKYNTYRIDGLPPTPIANPGRAAIEAVLNPPRTKDIYFVADGTGGHAFAPTLNEHNRNVANWRKIERERRKAEKAKEEAVAAGSSEPSTGSEKEPAPDTATAEADTPAPAAIITETVPQTGADVQTGTVTKTPAAEPSTSVIAKTQPGWQHTQIEKNSTQEQPQQPEQTAAAAPEPEPAPAVPSGPALSILQEEPVVPRKKPEPQPAAKDAPGTAEPAPQRLVLKNVPLPRPKPTPPGQQSSQDDSVTDDGEALAVTTPEPDPVPEAVPARSPAAPRPALQPGANLK